MTWWQYLLLANLYLVLFYGFYMLLLRRETFFQLNRVYLVASAVLSFLIPAIQADWVQNLFITQQVNHIIYNQPVIIYQYTVVAEDNRISIGQILAMIYAAGIILLTCRLIWQLYKLKKLVDQPQTAAFSFFKKINVNHRLSNSDIITAHEEVHAKQWHSADVLIMEVIMILNWFNPVVYFYRRAIKHIHEFIADSQVIKTGADKAGYAMILLTHTLNSPSHSLANQFFNHKLLKKRIIMLQKSRSQRIKLAKYGLSAPLFALMLVLSSATVNNSKAVEAINNTAVKVFEAPAKETVVGTIASANKAISNVIDNSIKTTDDLKPVTDTVPDPNEVFTAVEQNPEFPGGMAGFGKFLSANVRYPKADRDNNIAGRVFLTFIVQKDGSLSDIKVLRGLSSTIDAEAVRVMKLSPKWKPGIQNGKPVRFEYTVPISFNLDSNVGVAKAESNLPGVNINGQDQKVTKVRINGKDISEDDMSANFNALSGIVMPEFPGGQAEFKKYLQRNLLYPAIDRKNNVSGKVYIQFIVREDGTLSNLKAIRTLSLSTQNEAIRVLAKSPKWTPGKKDGKPVKVQMVIPVNFSLAHDDPDPAEPTPVVANPTVGVGLDEVVVVGFGSKNKEQLILLDGEEISQKTMDALDSKLIESVNVLTGDDAIGNYGERGKNGVVIITSKANKAPGQAASDFFIKGTSGLNADPALRPLIIVDGVEKSYDELQKIDVKTIGSVSIHKDAASIKRYGEKGKNGVLEVSTQPRKPLRKE